MPPLTARDHLQRAETILLDARHDGETGFVAPVNDIAAARAAVARNDVQAVSVSLGAARQALAAGT